MRDVGAEWGDLGAHGQRPAEPGRYCVRCQAPLPTDLVGVSQCLRCGTPFMPGDPNSYRLAQIRRGTKFWTPAAIAAIVAGPISAGIVWSVTEFDVDGYNLSVTVGALVTVVMGVVLGYGHRLRTWCWGVLAVESLALLATPLLLGDPCAFFLAIVVGILFSGATIVGIIIGFGVRLILGQTTWDQRWFFPPV